MPCTKAKSMRFRAYKCDPFGTYNNVHDEGLHEELIGEFDIVSGTDTHEFCRVYYGAGSQDYGITEYSIPYVMFKKLFNYEGKYAVGWSVGWSGEGPFISGTIMQNIFYIRRVV
jgi:hypothetical protein